MRSFVCSILVLLLSSSIAQAGETNPANLTQSVHGCFGLAIFVAAYGLVILEERLHLRKSKPMIIAAGVIWIMVAVAYSRLGDNHTANEAISHNLTEYGELFLFLIAAMTYINAMSERNEPLANVLI